MRAAFEKLSAGDSCPEVWEDVAVTLDAPETQPAGAGAIELDVRIENRSSRDLETFTPYDHMHYVLTNEEGWPVNVAPPAPRALVHPRSWSVGAGEGYLQVRGIRCDGEQRSPAEEIGREKVLLPAGSTYTYRLAIPRMVVVGSDGKPAAPEPSTTLIQPGTYGLVVILSLVAMVDGRKCSRMLRSQTARLTLA